MIYILCFRISSAKFQALAKEITDTFPGEKETTYYEQFMVINGIQINASGKLWYHFNYKKTVLRKDKLLQNCKSDNTVQPTLSEDILAKLNVLKTLVDPWIKVATLWHETFEARRIYLMKEKTEVENYLKSHACLRVDRALELFESDFNCLYPENLSLLLTNWSKTRNFLIKKLSTLKITNVEDKGLVHFLSTLPLGLFSISFLLHYSKYFLKLQAKLKFIADNQDTILFYLLPYLIPAGSRRKRNYKGIENNPVEKTCSKRSFQERRNSFLIHLEVSYFI